MNRKIILYISTLIIVQIYFGCASSNQLTDKKNQKLKTKELSAEEQKIALQHYINGSEKESKGDFTGAIVEYLDALRLDENDAIYFALAKNYEALGKLNLSKEMLEKAIKKDSTKTEYYSLLSNVLFQLGENEYALNTLKIVVDKEPENLEALFTIAKISESSNPQLSIEMYKKVLNQAGPSWDIYSELAKLYILQKKFEDAAAIYNKMLSIDKNNRQLRQAIIDMYIRAEKFELATNELKKIISEYPNDYEAQQVLADILIREKKWSEASKYLDIILESDSTSFDSKFRAAYAYFSQSYSDTTQIAKTKQILTDLSFEEPNDWKAHFYLGIIYAREKNDSLAIKMFEKVTSLASWNSEAWSILSSIYFERKEYEQMINILNSAINYIPKDYKLHYLLGVAYTQLQQNQKAIASYEKSRELNPKDENTLSALGLEYDNVKNFIKSDSTYEAALKINPENPLVLNNYAYSLSERGINLQKAFSMSKRSLEKDSLNSSFLDTFGWINFKLGNYDLAEKYIKKAIENGEASAVVLEHLGDVFAKKKEIDKAKVWWSKALEKNQNNSLLKDKIYKGGQ